MRLTHHPDGYISIDGNIFPLEFWALVEPDYTLPEGYIGRLFTVINGVTQVHHLIHESGDYHQPENWEWSAGQAYENRVLDYLSAFHSWKMGADIENQNGIIVIKTLDIQVSPSTLIANGTDVMNVTATANNAGYSGSIQWKITLVTVDPPEVLVDESSTMVGGVDTMPFSTLQAGIYLVEVTGHGRSENMVEAL